MGLALLFIKTVAERFNRTRIGHAITVGVAVAVIAFAVIVAVLDTSLLVMAFLGYHP